MKDSAKHVAAAGGAQAKSGLQALPLSRPAGFAQAKRAVDSRARSGHPASKTANHWVGPEFFGANENVKGYGS